MGARVPALCSPVCAAQQKLCPSMQDIIETNLLKEIGVRSNSFFEATGLIQVHHACHQLQGPM